MPPMAPNLLLHLYCITFARLLHATFSVDLDCCALEDPRQYADQFQSSKTRIYELGRKKQETLIWWKKPVPCTVAGVYLGTAPWKRCHRVSY